jgi:hypothetical protein
MKARQPEHMTSTGQERMQRWAAFSVRAHGDRASLATDLLLYDKLILPVPEDEKEFARWARNQWKPEDLAKTVVEGGDRILPVPWTAQLRAQFDNDWEPLRYLGKDAAYGLTGIICATSAAAWQEIYASLDPLERPTLKPALFAGFQSAEEAKAALALKKLKKGAPATTKKPETMPGGRPVDIMVAMHIRRLVREPDIADPNRAFETSMKLVQDPVFLQARQGLFDWEDRLYVDHFEDDEAQRGLEQLQEAYRDALRKHTNYTRLRWVSTLASPAEKMLHATGNPHLAMCAKAVGWVASFVEGHFFPAPEQPGIERHPGAALEMIRVAFREQAALTPEEEEKFKKVA